MKKFIIKSNNIIIKPFEKETISKKFISFLNNPKVNKHLTVKENKPVKAYWHISQKWKKKKTYI